MSQAKQSKVSTQEAAALLSPEVRMGYLQQQKHKKQQAKKKKAKQHREEKKPSTPHSPHVSLSFAI